MACWLKAAENYVAKIDKSRAEIMYLAYHIDFVKIKGLQYK